MVLCNGDSLGLPRENVTFSNTWFFKLANSELASKFYFVNNFKRSLTSKDLYSKDFLENYQPSIVILQVGIVDCAPRLYKTNSLLVKIINRSPSLIKNTFWVLSKKYKKRSSVNADVYLNEFGENISSYLKRCEKNNIKNCIIIKIQIPGEVMIKKSPDIMRAIEIYNNKIEDVSSQYKFVKIISPLSSGCNDDYVDDGYHLNKKGFQKVFIELHKILNEID